MKKNIGTTDRLIRFLVALLLLIVAWFQQSFIILGLALFVFYEAFASWCLFYQLTGKNTCPIDPNQKK